MRWKLIVAASSVSTLAAALAWLGLTALLGAVSDRMPTAGWRSVVPSAASLLIVAGAGLFVYRHTARLRLLQICVTVAASATLTYAAVKLARLLLLG